MATDYDIVNHRDCYIAYTNEETHRIIRDNLHLSPLYAGVIEGIGPRYCPSIEDKVVRFPDRKRHQLFIEPCGLDTEELYLQGMSSSLPFDVQLKMYRTIEGLERVEIMRAAYAIEYDCCDPLSLFATLESKQIKGLYGAGQFNGSSGYEEAAAQGLIAGINAAFSIIGRGEFILTRDSSYIGTLIDDLVTKGVDDPYRMLTSRSEYRLLLRQDNADRRLSEIGREIGLLSEHKYAIYLAKKQCLEQELCRVKHTTIGASTQLNEMLISKNLEPISSAISLEQLLKRPPVTYDDLKEMDITRPDRLTKEIISRVEVEIKYEGYIARQLKQVAKLKKLEKTEIPYDIDYMAVTSLSLEAVDKLTRVKPKSIGQASRISGVNPADIAVLTVYLKKHRAGGRQTDE
jgi:tRNA uridine 5-carboxymethylaminomethyl modification enzyme